MPARIALAILLLLSVAACGGAPAASPNAASQGTGSTAAPGAGTAAPSAGASTAAVDLSGVNVCDLVPESTVSALTGESGFTKDSRSNTHCFWGVMRAGVPQYLEIELSNRPNGIGDFNLNLPQNTCVTVPMSAAGLEAKGGDCTGAQHKVYLIAWANGVMATVLVNEPPAGTTPATLVQVAQDILQGL